MLDLAPTSTLTSRAFLDHLLSAPLHPLLDVDPRHVFRLDPAFLAAYEGREPAWGPLGAITFARTYPRFLYDLGRFETAAEVFARCTEFVMGTLALRAEKHDNHWNPEKAQRDGQEMFRRMWALKILPAGRGLANLGTDAVLWKGGACLFNCFTGDTRLFTREHGLVALSAVVGSSVTVLGKDGWRAADVRAFGLQTVREITFAPRLQGRTNVRRRVIATANHRWPLTNGTWTTDLRVGDCVRAAVSQPTRDGASYREGVRHGLIFGDGTHTSTQVGGTRIYSVRLCGPKARFVDYFDKRTDPPSNDGDPLMWATSASMDLKAVPTATDPEYLAGFIDGWTWTDGDTPTKGNRRLSTQDATAAAWLEANAPYAGYVVSGNTSENNVTNYGPRAAPLIRLTLAPSDTPWKVLAIDELPEPVETFCAVVPGETAFTLEWGIYTGNCGFQTTARDRRFNPVDVAEGDELAFPAAQTMDYLMLGVGVGFDLRGAVEATPIVAPVEGEDVHRVEDTREGWVASVVRLLRAFRGVGTLPARWDTTGLRKKGVPLKTFGGVSSGPAPLIELLRTLTGLLSRYVGRTVDAELLTDVENVIGRCVVAGGVRRSSEIALGPMAGPGAAEFSALKDPAALRGLLTEQGLRELGMAPVVALNEELTRLRAVQAAHSVLSPAFAELQDAIDTATTQRSALLYADPAWAALEAQVNAHPLRAWRWASNNSVLATPGADYSDIGPRIAENGEPGVLWLDNVRRFGRMRDGDLTQPRLVGPDVIPGLRPDTAQGVNPCGEIGLESGELCNLVETFPSRHDSVADWHASLKYAYLIAKAVSDIPIHNPATALVQRANRRLGISITGITAWYVKLGMDRMCEALDQGYRLLRGYDRLYSGWLGVPESIRLTTVKPSGTVSLLAGVEGGMRFPEAPFCARTIRIHDTSPLIDRLTDAGYRVEPDRYAPSTVVAYFPMRDREVGRYAPEVSVWEQAQLQAALQGWWADNLVSATWTFRRTEAGDIPRVLSAFDRLLKGCSALPIDGHSYVQPPYAPITEREFEEMSHTRPLDLTNLGAIRDRDEKFCDSGTCSIPG